MFEIVVRKAQKLRNLLQFVFIHRNLPDNMKAALPDK